VGTLPECRGRGVMSSILQEVCRSIHEQGMDFAWLGGDRLRYGRYGWARGGFHMRFDFTDRYLPPPPAEGTVRPLDRERDFDLVREAASGAPSTILMPDKELRLRLSAPGMGWVIGKSFIITDYARDDSVALADGDPEEIALLLAHHLAHIRKADPTRGRISAQAGPHATAAMRAFRKYHASSSLGPLWMFRVGRLVPLLEKMCRAAAPRIGRGTDRLEMVNSDTGEAATIVCRGGKARVLPEAGPDAPRFSTTDLSDICFGPFPLDMFFPGLAKDSPIRRIFPLPAFISRFFAL